MQAEYKSTPSSPIIGAVAKLLKKINLSPKSEVKSEVREIPISDFRISDSHLIPRLYFRVKLTKTPDSDYKILITIKF